MHEHKHWVSSVFDKAAPLYGKESAAFFNYFGKRLVEQVNIAPHQSALDVATGKGAVLFPLAEVIGPSGKVVGIDISKEMIQETSKEACAKNMDWVTLHEMDAENLHFPDASFDSVFCGFGLFFLPSILKGLSECKRVLKPGGKLAVSIWGKSSTLKTWLDEEIKKCAGPIKSPVCVPLRSEEELDNSLKEAGFHNIQIFEETKTFLHPTPEEWWENLWGHATRAKLEQLSSGQLASLYEKSLKKAKNSNQGQGVPEELQVFYGVAQK